MSHVNYEEIDSRIIDLVIKEKTNKEIAEIIGYSTGLVKFRLLFLFRKYHVKTKAGLVREVMTENFKCLTNRHLQMV